MTTNKILWLPLSLLAILVLLSCDDEGDDPSNPIVEAQILLSPSEIMMNDNESSTISLTVQPASEFEWNVTARPDWLDISPASGMISNSIVELQLTPNPEGLSRGKHFGTIEIISNGAGVASSDVVMCVNARPVAALSSSSMSFLATESQKSLVISNVGTGFLTWDLEDLPSWIDVSRSSGILDEGQSTEVTVLADRSGLEPSTQSGQMTLVSNSQEGDLNIDLSLEVPEQAILNVHESSIEFDYFDSQMSLSVRNDGNIAFNWNVDLSAVEYLSADAISGNLTPGQSENITFTLDRSNLESDVFSASLIVSNDYGQSETVAVAVQNYKEEKWLFDGTVIDAEYDKNNDVIVAVLESPNELRIFDPKTNSSESIALNLPPTCVSVSVDGKFAAVGHNGNFAYVNLSTMEIERNYAVTTDAWDIILAPNDWVYVFPARDQWERIRCIRLSTGVETEHTGNSIRERTKVKLHPSGIWIYGADNGLSPSDFEKYYIGGGTAEYLYDSPYHGDFAFSGDIWISEDGARLFAKSRNVFNTSSNRDLDMTYNGELVGEGRVMALDYSSDSDLVLAVFSDGNVWDDIPGNEIRKYETDFLGFQGVEELPGFLIPDGSGGGSFYESQGHFVFFNEDGSKYFVLVKVEDGSGAQNEWAIVSKEVE